MMRSFRTFVLAVAAAFASVASAHGLGYRITSCTYDVYGLDVEFETQEPPPYLVSVFLAEEYGFGRRVMSLRTKLVDTKVARLTGDFYSRGNSFVQVGSPSLTNDPSYRVLGESEAQEYFDSLRASIDHSVISGKVEDVWSEATSETEARIVSDYKWGTFVVSSCPTITVHGVATGFREPVVSTNSYQTAYVYRSMFDSNTVSGVITPISSDVVTNSVFPVTFTNEYTDTFHSSSTNVQRWIVHRTVPQLDFRDSVVTNYDRTYDTGDSFKPYSEQVVEHFRTNLQQAAVLDTSFVSNTVSGIITDYVQSFYTNYYYVAGPTSVDVRVSFATNGVIRPWRIVQSTPLGHEQEFPWTRTYMKTHWTPPIYVQTNYQDAVVNTHVFVTNTANHATSEYDNVSTNHYYDATVTSAVTVVSVSTNGANVATKTEVTTPQLNVREESVYVGDQPTGYVGVTDYDKQIRTYETEEQTFGPFDTSVGCGYRIIVDERNGRYDVTRAYSLFDDMSQEIVLRRPLKPISASNGLKIVKDWLGFVKFATETSAVPNRIYWEGL